MEHHTLAVLLFQSFNACSWNVQMVFAQGQAVEVSSELILISAVYVESQPLSDENAAPLLHITMINTPTPDFSTDLLTIDLKSVQK